MYLDDSISALNRLPSTSLVEWNSHQQILRLHHQTNSSDMQGSYGEVEEITRSEVSKSQAEQPALGKGQCLRNIPPDWVHTKK